MRPGAADVNKLPDNALGGACELSDIEVVAYIIGSNYRIAVDIKSKAVFKAFRKIAVFFDPLLTLIRPVGCFEVLVQVAGVAGGCFNLDCPDLPAYCIKIAKE
jgi:hypothetical protein